MEMLKREHQAWADEGERQKADIASHREGFRAGYRKALEDVVRRLDNLMEGGTESMEWHRGVLAARHELHHLKVTDA